MKRGPVEPQALGFGGFGRRLFSLENPDVILSDAEGTFVIEAKRVVSAKKLQANIEKATQQIVARGHRGLIALDASARLNPHERVLRADSFEEGKACVDDLAFALGREHNVARWVRNHDAGGLVEAVLVVVFTAIQTKSTAGIAAMQSITGGPIVPFSSRGRDLMTRLLGQPVKSVFQPRRTVSRKQFWSYEPFSFERFVQRRRDSRHSAARCDSLCCYRLVLQG